MADGEAAPGAGDGGTDTSGGAPADDIEARARRYGWVPEPEFKGNKQNWTDAHAWVTRTENELPVALSTIGRLERTVTESQRAIADRDKKLDAMSGDLGEMKQTLTEFREFARKGNETAYARAKRELEAQLEQQIGAADVAGSRETRQSLAELEAAKPQPEPVRVAPKIVEPPPKPVAEAPKIDPHVPVWVEENRGWYLDGERPELRALAESWHAKLLRTEPGLTMQQNLAKVRGEVVRRYPEHFSNPNRDSAAAVSEPTGGGPRPRGNGRTFADLPADAKAAYARFKKQMPDFTEKQYLESYVWE